MALISFGTPVSGINRSDGTFNGPLESLYRTDGNTDFLKYPRDLDSSTRSHVVLFTIKEIQEVGLDEAVGFVKNAVDRLGSKTDSATQYAQLAAQEGSAFSTVELGRKLESGVEVVSEAIKNPKETFNNIIDSIPGLARSAGETVDAFKKSITNRRTTTKAFIALYMPENVSFSYDPNYNDSVTLASVAGAIPVVGKTVSAITGLAENDFVKFLLNKAGYVFNPEAQVLFNGITFRSFSMSFTFTPYSKREADDVRRIIKMFRSHAAPRKVKETAGMFFIPPSIFNIDFNFKGRSNEYINKVGDCVIENIDVNYTPNGWSAHNDGSPVQTVVTIQFKEIVLVDRDMIENKGF